MCRIVSVSAEIQNNERVSEFTDPPSLNSDTGIWIQRRLWITSSAEPDMNIIWILIDGYEMSDE